MNHFKHTKKSTAKGNSLPRSLRMILPLIVLILSVALSSCGSEMAGGAKDAYNSYEYDSDYYTDMEVAETEAETAEEEAYDEAASGVSNSLTENRKIILNYDVSISVDDVIDKQQAIAEAAKSRGGYVESSSVYEDRTTSAHLTIRLPADQAESFNESLKNYGSIKSANADAVDVTFEHQDLEARLKNAERQNAKLQEYLEDAETVEELLAVQREIDIIQERIEQLNGKLKYYDDQVSYSTFYINLSLDQSLFPQGPDLPNIVSGSEFSEKISLAFKKGWVNFVNGVANLTISLAGAFIPLIILVVISFVIILIIVKSTNRNRQKKRVPVNQNDQNTIASNPVMKNDDTLPSPDYSEDKNHEK